MSTSRFHWRLPEMVCRRDPFLVASVWFVLALLSALPLGASAKAAAPDGSTPSPEEPRPSWPKKQHPYLLFDEQGLQRLRAAGGEGLHKRMLAHFRTMAAEYVGRPPTPAPSEAAGSQGFLWWHVTAYHTCYEYRHALEVLSFLAIVTGDEQYVQAAKRWLLALCTWKHWGADAGQDVDYPGAWLTVSAAISYDWLWPYLSSSERQTVQKTLASRIRLVHGRKPPAWESHAMWIYPATATAVVSVLWEEPQAAQWLSWFRAEIHAYLDRAYTSEGEGIKGISYFGMVLCDTAIFLESLRQATGEDDFDSPVWRAGIPYAMHCWTGGNYARYWDREQAWDRSLNTLMLLMARKYRSSAAQWVAIHDERLLLRPFADDKGYAEYGHPSGVLSYVWYDPSVPATLPSNTPLAAWFRGIGLVVMRSGWDEQAICLSLKSGIRGPHESFAQNRFNIDACGQRLTTEFYEDYHTSTDGFNVISVNGQQQASPPGASGNVTEHLAHNRVGRIAEFVDLRHYSAVCGDARQAYPADCSRYEREIFYLRPHTFIIVDHVATRAPADLVWRLHTTGSISLEENLARIDLEKASLAVTRLEPQTGRLRVGNTAEIWQRHKLRDSPWYAPYGANLWRKADGGRAWPLSQAQWYLPQPILEIEPKERTTAADFVTLIEVLPKAISLPRATTERDGKTVRVSVQGNPIAHAWYYHPTGAKDGALRCDGEAAAIGRSPAGELAYIAMHRGTRLEADGVTWVQSDRELTWATDVDRVSGTARATVFGAGPTTVTLQAPAGAKSLHVDGRNYWHSAAQQGGNGQVVVHLEPGEHQFVWSAR